MNNPRPEIGIFGGTFNPIHFGHLRIAEQTRERLSLEKIIFIPSCMPPLKKQDVIDAEDRLEMVRLAIRGNPFFELSDMECKRHGPSYTVETLLELKDTMKNRKPVFIIGIDSFLELPLWYRPEEVIGLTDFAVLNRPPHHITELYSSPYVIKDSESTVEGIRTLKLSSGKTLYIMPVTGLNISASEIRRLRRNGKSIKYLLPESVESYIISKGLYKKDRE
ncbi:MAG: nicotinate (nicotinamide) nucleotide adenylyltransferase [Nitrospirae bacterium]|nr:MAG: nicotinate (nicotinamide) nucleotide adenylyltransferase [Nitrospirota bacterium]